MKDEFQTNPARQNLKFSSVGLDLVPEVENPRQEKTSVLRTRFILHPSAFILAFASFILHPSSLLLLCLLALATPCRAQTSGFPWQPPQASNFAYPIDFLFYTLLCISAVIAGGVCLLIVYFCYKYRRGAKMDRSNPPAGNWRLETAWIGIPILISIGVYLWSARLYYGEFDPPPGAINIDVVGKQWMWKLQHPGGQQEIDELHIPVGVPIKLSLTSEDVIHDFFVPAFRIKMDVLPGRYTTEWFVATKVGRYHLYCAQYCGQGHAGMGGWIYAMNPADYQSWLNGSHMQPSLVEQGEKLFVQYGCSGCHGHSATIRAPSLDGLFGRPVPLTNGQMVIADEKYIHDKIYYPENTTVKGYKKKIMPSFKDAIPPEQVLEIIAYIRSLGQVGSRENGPPDNYQNQRIQEQRERVKEIQREKGLRPTGTQQEPVQPTTFGGVSNRPSYNESLFSTHQDRTQPNTFDSERENNLPPQVDTTQVQGIQRSGNDMQQQEGANNR